MSSRPLKLAVLLLPSLLSSLLLLAFAPLAQAAPFNESWVDFNINTNTGK